MATVDRLDFKLVVDDTAFNQKITQAIQNAKNMNKQISNYLSSFSSMSGIVLPDFSAMTAQATTLASVMTQVKQSIMAAKNELRQATIEMKNFRAAAEGAEKAVGKLEQKVKTAADRSDRMSKSMQSVSRSVTTADRKMQNFVNSTKAAANHLASMGFSINQQRTSLNGLTSGLMKYVTIWSSFRFVKSIAEVTGEFEKQRVSLENILQNASGADKIFNQIRDFSVKSPFQFSELTDYVKQLSAFSVPMEELFDTTKMLADVSAGLGVDMNRIVLAYGQIRSAAFLRGQEVRQLTEAGIPILAELSKQIEELEGHAVSAAQVFDKISTRQISFEMVEKVFKDMTSEGGKFYKMQEVQAETLAGKISNLKDAYQIMLDNFGKANDGLLRGGLNGITKMMQHYRTLGWIIVDVAAMMGTRKVAHVFYNFGEEVLKASRKAAKAVGGFSKLKIFLYSMGHSFAGLSVALGALAGTLILQAINNANRLGKELDKLASTNFNEMKSQVDTLDTLVDSLGKMNKGSQDYADTIARLNRQYGDYLDNLISEADSYEAIQAAAEKAAEAIRKKYQVDAYEQGLAKIREETGTKVIETRNHIFDVLTDAKYGYNMGEAVASAFLDAFEKEIKSGANESKDIFDILKDTFNRFFEDSEYFDPSQAYQLWGGYEDLIKKLSFLYKKEGKDIEKLNQSLHSTFTTNIYDTAQEAEMISKIKEEYVKLRANVLANTPKEEKDEAIKELDIKELKSILSVYQELGRTEKVKEVISQLNELSKVQTGWQKIVNETLEAFSGAQKNKFKVDDTSNYLDFIDKLRKSYKALGQDIADTPKGVDESIDSMRQGLEEEKDAIEAIAKSLHVSLQELEKERSPKDPYVEQRKEQKERINHVKQLMSEYDSLASKGINDEGIKRILSLIYPDDAELIKTGKFAEAINECADALEKFGDAEGADSARMKVGKDKFSQYLDSFNNLEKFRDKMMDWIKNDLDLDGEGLTLDIQKIFKDLNAKNLDTDINMKQTKLLFEAAKKDEQALAEVREKYGEEVWLKYLNEGWEAIKELGDREKSNNRKLAQDKINDLATAYLKEQKDLGKIDLSALSKKTLAQLSTLRADIAKVASSEGLGISEALQTEAKGLEVTFGTLEANIKKALTTKYSEVTVEMLKRLKKSAEEVIDAVGQIGGHIAEMGEAAGSDGVERLGIIIEQFSKVANIILESESLFQQFAEKQVDAFSEVVGAVAETTDGMAEVAEATGEAVEATEELGDAANDLAKSKDWITMIVKLVLMLVEAEANAYTGMQKLHWAIKDAAEEMRILSYEAKLANGVDTIFGEDSLQSIRNATSALREMGRATRKDIEYMKSINGEFKFKGGLFNLARYSDSINQFVRDTGAELYDEYGNLNADTLQKLLDTYDTLTKKDREWIQQMIDDSTLYKEAMDQLADYIGSVFGNLSSEIADSMISAFKATGDAVSDLEDIFAGMGATLTKSILESLVLENVLNKYKDQLLGVAQRYGNEGNETAMMQQVADIMASMRADLESQADVYNAILQYADNLGWLADSQENGLSNGIKGITEETADLLASYLNAIRADVSVGRVQWTQIAADIREMAGIVGSVPNIGEYLAQIQANTYDTAVASQSILAELRSVMTTEGGALAFRTLGY